MTNEEVYERITSVLEEQGIAMNQFELKVKPETGKYPNLRITKITFKFTEYRSIPLSYYVFQWWWNARTYP